MSNMSDIVLVSGAAASGKSALGERICCATGGRMVYIAAMQPFGEDARERIARHHAMRAGKGFRTVERYTGLDELDLGGPVDVALLEDLGNFVANQMFAAGTPVDALTDTVLRGIGAVAAQTGRLVVIANDIFAGAERFEGEMGDYVRCLAEVGRQVACRAAVVVESVCGLPYWIKGEQLL